MTRLQALIAALVFGFVAAATTVARLAYELFVLHHTDEKLGVPTDQFQTMAGVHILATTLAALAFGLVLLLVSRSRMRAKTAIVASICFGAFAGFVSVLTLSKALDFMVPLRGIAGDFVSVILAGAAIGLVVRALGVAVSTRAAV